MIFLETIHAIALVAQVTGPLNQQLIFLGMITILFMTVIPIKPITTPVEQIISGIMFVISKNKFLINAELLVPVYLGINLFIV